MRERLVAAFVGLTILVVALYGVPRAYVLADLVRSHEQDQARRTVALVAAVLDERSAAGPVDPAYLDRLAGEDESIELRSDDGTVVVTSNWSEPTGDDLSASADARIGTVTLVLDEEAVDAEITGALLPLLVLGVVLVLLAGVAGLLLSRRIARPFQDLATAARGLGAGQLHPTLPAFRVPEAREIADALTVSGARLDALLRHERELTVHASHELRTPVTALRLDLEDIALWPETPPSVAAQLQRSIGELDRLSAAITDLLAATRDLSAAMEIDLDLDALIADTVTRVATLGRRVTHVSTGPLPTRLDPAPVVQALELLIGGGNEVRATDRGTHLEVAITSAAQDPAVASRQRDLAADLVAAAGGALNLTADGIALQLPKRPLSSP